MRARATTVFIALGGVLFLFSARVPLAQTAPVLAAMADELARSMAQIRMKDQPAPYFIEYEVEERAATRVTARMGALVEDLTGRSRTLRVGVRVGSYNFDNSLFNATGSGGVVSLTADGRISAPLDDDYDAMRRQIWLATDAAYKRAVSVYARKQAAFQNRADADAIPDFSREDPQTTDLGGLPPVFVNRDWPERARQISAAFSGFNALDNSDVSVADTRGTRYYVNSEGFKVVAPVEIASLRVGAETQAADGMVIRDAFTLVEKRLQDLPPAAELAVRARRMGERLTAQRAAPIGEEYTGPVLLEGQASAELVAGVLAPAVLGRRPQEAAGRGGRGGVGGVSVSPFHRRIGLRVMSESFSASDTPSLRQFEGRPVAGAYTVDDQGVRAKDVSLVEKGRLITLLAGRAPLKGLLQSSGHTRGPDVLPGVFQLQTSEPVSAAELKAKYLELLVTQDKEFGYIVRGLASPAEAGGAGGPMIIDAVRVTRDGREQLVRGVRLGTVPPAAYRDLYAASRERTLYNFRGTTNDAVSIIAPNIIYEELEVQQARDITQKPPEVRSPLSLNGESAK
jgi:hypothetical protein